MNKFIKKIFGRDSKNGKFTTKSGVEDALSRVDTQIGRAVERLGSR